jgi:hypothetical protein
MTDILADYFDWREPSRKTASARTGTTAICGHAMSGA